MRVSQLVKVRALALVLGLVLVPSLAVLTAPPSAAAINPGSPLGYPASAVSGGSIDLSKLLAFVKKNPTKIPVGTSAPTVNKLGLRNAGKAVGVAGAGIIAFEGTSAVLRMFGAPSSGDTWCDLTMVVSGNGECGRVASPEYTPNSDFTFTPPGWNKAPSLQGVGSADAVTFLAEYLGTGQIAAGFVERPDMIYSRPNSSYSQNVVLLANCRDNSNRVRQYTLATASTGTSVSTRPVGDIVLPGGRVDVFQTACPAGSKFDTATVTISGEDGGYSLGTVVATFYPVGHSDRPVEVDSNPMRWWRTEWTCSTGAPGVAWSQPFKETDGSWPAMPEAKCSGSAVPVTIRMYQITKGLSDTLVYSWDAPQNFRNFADAYPECVGGGCELLLKRIDEVTGKKYSCFANPSLCEGWWKDPAKETKYQCTYGDKTVDLNECRMYAPTFDGRGYGDPETGDEPTPAPTPTPTAQPTPTPSPSPSPEPSPSPSNPVLPDPPAVPDPQPPAQPENGCPPPFSWLSLFNPWYYFKGVSCALEWAFVPSTAAVTANVGKVATSWNGSAPAKWVGAVGDIFDGVAVQEAGCSGPRLRWDYANLTLYPFSACEEPQKTWAVWVKAFASAAIVFTGGFAALRAVGSGLGWKPSAGGDS